ncbi:hypothetical protein CCACVL1_27831 [Corchorus capsularis]|uniref:Uncharacterized protein n=1 Tax=Corchorus capsularis TaxID=210143 RepID=A0A1R3G8L1_COCAP|nr:hypothetical protein CCACVL1_27831 [Corchorus capsularis]
MATKMFLERARREGLAPPRTLRWGRRKPRKFFGFFIDPATSPVQGRLYDGSKSIKQSMKNMVLKWHIQNPTKEDEELFNGEEEEDDETEEKKRRQKTPYRGRRLVRLSEKQNH